MTRRSLDRRTVLRGAAVTLALPWLEAMLPNGRLGACAQQASPSAPRRAVWVYLPNGLAQEPLKAAAGFQLQGALAPLAPLSSSVMLIHGLAQDAARAHGDGPGDHARACAAFLTGVHPLKKDGAVLVGASADQLAAQQIGNRTRLRSLVVGAEGSNTSGQCDSGYACAYSSQLSWAGPSTPAGKEHRPMRVYERLFLDEEDPAFLETMAERRARRRSVLDFVRGEARRLEQRLGQADRQKLEEYQDGIRELERRLERMQQGEQQARALPPPPKDAEKNYPELVRAHYDLIAMALATDSTRIATFLLANEGSNRGYPHLGIPEGHHELSHHGKDPHKLTQWEKIGAWHVDAFAAFLKRLTELREGESSVLDSTMVLFGSAIGDGNRHNHDQLPILLAGAVRGGREVEFAQETSLNRLHLALTAHAGASLPRLGDADLPLDLA